MLEERERMRSRAIEPREEVHFPPPHSLAQSHVQWSIYRAGNGK